MKSGNQDALDLEPTMLAHLFRVLLNDIDFGFGPEPAEGSEPVEGCDDGSQWESEEFSAVSGATPPDSGDEWDFVARKQGTLIEYP